MESWLRVPQVVIRSMAPIRGPGQLLKGHRQPRAEDEFLQGYIMLAVHEGGNVSPDGRLLAIHDALWRAYGPQGWWPAPTPTETIIGAILVQHTSWRQVQAAIAGLSGRGLLDFEALAGAGEESLAEILRPAGTPRVKARRLLGFAEWLGRAWSFDLTAVLGRPAAQLRQELLTVHGIGPETADCIVLYAAEQPVFVVDAYTRRVLRRHHVIPESWNYDRIQQHAHAHLPADAALFNESHALFVQVGKLHCRPQAQCEGCPLQHLPHNPTL
jgi:endonuclease-3 related protein